MAQTKASPSRFPVLKICLGILLLLLLLVFFLPQLSSTNFASGKLKEIINEKAPGKLDFSNVNLSWTGGLEVSNLQYQDDIQGIALTVDEVSTTKGLLSLATNYKDVGVINVIRPQAIITIPQESVAANQEAVAKPRKTNDSAEVKSNKQPNPSVQDEPFTLPPINVHINITEGSLLTVESSNATKSIIEDINLQLKLDGPAGALDYQLSFNNGQASGKVIGEGNILLPQGTAVDLSAIQSQATLSIENFQIADFLSLAASRSDVPNGEGLLNGTLQLEGEGISTFSLTGTLTGRAIKLHGGPLHTDTPAIDEFTVKLNAVTNDKQLEIETLSINSPYAIANITGKTSDNILQTLTAKAQVNIAEIFSQFPATLNLQQGMLVSEGMIDIDANLDTVGNDTVFKASGHLERLVGTTGKKKISLEQPVDIAVSGTTNETTINLDNLVIASSFLTAKGSGNIDAMQLKVGADIGKALNELNKFIDLGGLESDGKLDLALKIAGSSLNSKKVTGNLQVDGFELHYDKAQISPKDTLSVTFDSELLLEGGSALKELNKSRLEFVSWLGKGIVTADTVVPNSEDSPAIIKNGRLEGDFDLDRVTTLLHSMKALPKEQQLSGPLKLTADISGESVEKPSVHLSLNISPFSYTQSEKTLTDDNVSIELDAQVDLAKKNYTLSTLNFSTTPLALATKGEMLTKNNDQQLLADGQSTFDLTALSQKLQSYANLELEMSGVSEKPFQLTTRTKDGQWTDIPKLTEFSTSFHADTIVGYGLTIESLDLPIQLKESIGAVDFKAKVNNGLMTLQPKVDFSGDYPVGSLPENSPILKDVELTEDMSNDLLSKVHPLFKGVVKTSGKVNLDMERTNWPIGENQQKDVAFAGSFTFDEVRLQAGGLITPLLAIMKTEEDSIMLSSEPMTFVGENQRVTCSALTASVNDYYSIIFEGSVGFDQSLDYVAKIPVTRKMVSSKIFEYLEGTYITVPIGGTVSKPKISKSFVQKALSDLVLQAGTKQLSDQAGKLLQNLFK